MQHMSKQAGSISLEWLTIFGLKGWQPVEFETFVIFSLLMFSFGNSPDSESFKPHFLNYFRHSCTQSNLHRHPCMLNIYPKGVFYKLCPQDNIPDHLLIVSASPLNVAEATSDHLDIAEVERISYFLAHAESLAWKPLLKMIQCWWCYGESSSWVGIQNSKETSKYLSCMSIVSLFKRIPATWWKLCMRHNMKLECVLR